MRVSPSIPAVMVTVLGLALSMPDAAALDWPAESWSAAADLTPLNPAGWASNLSGAYWNPQTRRLWVCLNGPAKFWSLREDGSGGFEVEREYAATGDLEGITQMSTATDRVFVVDEQARTIRAYRVSDGSAAGSWFLDTIPNWGNSGPEGLAFVPDQWLAQNNFVDGAGLPYPQSVHGGEGFGGIVFVAVQTSGWVYAVDLKTDGTCTTVGRYLTSRTESCDLAFDDSVGRMYILHNIDGNLLEVTGLASTSSGADRRFNTFVEVQVPSASNIEGFAITPAVAAGVVGDNWCFFTDDSNANGALRWFTQLQSQMNKLDGDLQTTETNSEVPVPPSVSVTDAFTNPLPGLAVTFEVTAGGGYITGGDTTADSAGVAQAGSWVLGATPGANTLAASAPGLIGSPQSFAATAIQGPSPDLPLRAAGMVWLSAVISVCAIALLYSRRSRILPLK